MSAIKLLVGLFSVSCALNNADTCKNGDTCEDDTRKQAIVAASGDMSSGRDELGNNNAVSHPAMGDTLELIQSVHVLSQTKQKRGDEAAAQKTNNENDAAKVGKQCTDSSKSEEALFTEFNKAFHDNMLKIRDGLSFAFSNKTRSAIYLSFVEHNPKILKHSLVMACLADSCEPQGLFDAWHKYFTQSEKEIKEDLYLEIPTFIKHPLHEAFINENKAFIAAFLVKACNADI